MPQIFLAQEQTTQTIISSRRIYLMGISCGLLLAALEGALILNGSYFHFSFFQENPLTLLGYASLLYFIAPIPVSFYIARQTSKSAPGWRAGITTGWSGALFTILVMIIYVMYIGGWSYSDLGFAIIPIVSFLNAFGALISMLGAVIGSALGQIGKHSVSEGELR